MKEKKVRKDFNAIDILDLHVRYYKGLKSNEYWRDLIEEFALKPPFRDDLVRHNHFICNVYYLFEGIDTSKSREEILDDLNYMIIEYGNAFRLLSKLEAAKRSGKIALRDLIHLRLLLYLYSIESILKSFMILLLKVLLMKREEIIIETKRNVKADDFWQYEDSSSRIPTRTIMKLKNITEIKRIREANQLFELYVREMANSFKNLGFEPIRDLLNKLCDFNLRNRIAHGNYVVNSHRKDIKFPDGSSIKFSVLEKRYDDIDVLLRIAVFSVLLSIILIEHEEYREHFGI